MYLPARLLTDVLGRFLGLIPQEIHHRRVSALVGHFQAQAAHPTGNHRRAPAQRKLGKIVPALQIGYPFTAPSVKPRISCRCAVQPRRTGTTIASESAIDMRAQKSPSDVKNEETNTGTVGALV